MILLLNSRFKIGMVLYTDKDEELGTFAPDSGREVTGLYLYLPKEIT
jgi:hypothetical protein